jgi:hypothetical protein
MPDTGAPWEIPYAAPSDLVSAWPALSEDIAEAVADGLTKALIKPSQVLTTTNFTSTSTTAVDLTGVEVTVTPTDATNRFLLLFAAQVASSANGGSNWYQFRRDTTDLFEEVQRRSGDNQDMDSFAMMFDEVAGNTTARTYKIRTRTSSGTQTVFSSSFVVVEYAV